MVPVDAFDEKLHKKSVYKLKESEIKCLNLIIVFQYWKLGDVLLKKQTNPTCMSGCLSELFFWYRIKMIS